MPKLLLGVIFCSAVEAAVFDQSFILGEGLEVSFSVHNQTEGSELGVGVSSLDQIFLTTVILFPGPDGANLYYGVEGILGREPAGTYFHETDFSRDEFSGHLTSGLDTWPCLNGSPANYAYLNAEFHGFVLASSSWDYYQFVSDHEYGADLSQFRASFLFSFVRAPEPATVLMFLIWFWRRPR